MSSQSCLLQVNMIQSTLISIHVLSIGSDERSEVIGCVSVSYRNPTSIINHQCKLTDASKNQVSVTAQATTTWH